MTLAFEASKVNTDRWYSIRPLSIAISEFSLLEAKDNALSPSTEPIHVILWFDVVPVMFGPNITGTYHVQSDIGAINRTGSVSGSFYKDGGEYYAVNGDITANGAQKLALSANRSSAIYGASIGVQPASQRFLACIKF